MPWRIVYQRSVGASCILAHEDTMPDEIPEKTPDLSISRE